MCFTILTLIGNHHFHKCKFFSLDKYTILRQRPVSLLSVQINKLLIMKIYYFGLLCVTPSCCQCERGLMARFHLAVRVSIVQYGTVWDRTPWSSLRFHRQQYPYLIGVCMPESSDRRQTYATKSALYYGKVKNKYIKLNITLCSAKTIWPGKIIDSWDHECLLNIPKTNCISCLITTEASEPAANVVRTSRAKAALADTWALSARCSPGAPKST